MVEEVLHYFTQIHAQKKKPTKKKQNSFNCDFCCLLSCFSWTQMSERLKVETCIRTSFGGKTKMEILCLTFEELE